MRGSEYDGADSKRKIVNYFLKDVYDEFISRSGTPEQQQHKTVFFNFFRALQFNHLLLPMIGLWSYDCGKIVSADYIHKKSDFGVKNGIKENGGILSITFDSFEQDNIGGGELKATLYRVTFRNGGWGYMKGLKPIVLFTVPFYANDNSIGLNNLDQIRRFSNIFAFTRSHGNQLNKEKWKIKSPIVAEYVGRASETSAPVIFTLLFSLLARRSLPACSYRSYC